MLSIMLLGPLFDAVVARLVGCVSFSFKPDMPFRRIASFLCKSAIKSPDGDDDDAGVTIAAGFYKDGEKIGHLKLRAIATRIKKKPNK